MKTPSDQPDRERSLDDIERTYRRYAETAYDRRWTEASTGARLALDERDAWLLSVLDPVAGKTIVDIGCGVGWLAVALDASSQRPNRFIGVDLLEDRVAEARVHAPWAEFQFGSADRVDLPDRSADAVTAITLLSSLTQAWLRRDVATEIARILRPGGSVVIYDLRYPSPRNPAVLPISTKELEGLFPGWRIQSRTMTLLPPLGRSWFGAGPRRYHFLARLPILRSHVGVVLHRPL